MKVVHIVTSISGGAGIATMRLHRALRNSGVESYVLQKVDTDERLKAEGVYTLYESTNLLYRLRRKLGLTPEKKQQKLISTYARNYEYEIATFPTTSYRIDEHPLVKNADIIHLHWIGLFLDYPTFFRKIKKPIVWTLHDKNPFHGLFHTETDELKNDRYIPLNKKALQVKKEALKNSTNIYIVTPSIWLLNKSKISEIFSSKPHKCISNIIDSHQKIDHLEALKHLGISNTFKTFIFIAHSIDIPRRGFFILKEALHLINSDLLNLNLITVGGDKIDLGIPSINHIHYEYTNNFQLINTLYSAADIQILPTMEDNLPNVMLESFANGTPVISFSNGGMAEHVHNGETGILVKEMNAVALKNAIEDFINNKYNFDRESIRNYAKKHFDAEKQALKYIELYKQILNS